jgi:hypothetical protein
MTQIQDDIVEYLNSLHDRLTEAVRSSTGLPQVQQMLGEITAKRDEFNQRIQLAMLWSKQEHAAQDAVLGVIDDVHAKLVGLVGSTTIGEDVK